MGVPRQTPLHIHHLPHLSNLLNFPHLLRPGRSTAFIFCRIGMGAYAVQGASCRSLLHATPPSLCEQKDTGVRPHADQHSPSGLNLHSGDIELYITSRGNDISIQFFIKPRKTERHIE